MLERAECRDGTITAQQFMIKDAKGRLVTVVGFCSLVMRVLFYFLKRKIVTYYLSIINWAGQKEKLKD